MLTPKQYQFCCEYLIDLNGTQAAIRAGYSKRTAQEQSSRLLSNVMVREAIDRAQTERAERLELDADWVVRNFRNLYLEALADRDFSVAARCLEMIGKHVGAFEKHQKQKREYTQADVERLKAELEAAGFDFRRTNFPSRN